jgi:hypothetical protein
VIGLPLSDGAVHDTIAAPRPALLAVTPVGWSGRLGPGVTPVDGSDAALTPTPFVAVTVKV